MTNAELEDVYQRCRHDAVGIALQVTKSREKAEDAVQEAAIELSKYVGQEIRNADHMFLHMVRQQAAQLMRPKGHRHAGSRDKDSREVPVAEYQTPPSQARYQSETFTGMGFSSGEYSQSNEPNRRFEYVGSTERFLGEVGVCPCGAPVTLRIERGFDRDRRQERNISFLFKVVGCWNGHRYYEGRPKASTLKRYEDGTAFRPWALGKRVSA